MVTWRRATKHLLEQDGGFEPAQLRALRHRMKARGVDVVGELRRAALAYLHPRFHPDAEDNHHLAGQYFASLATS